jgi:two-component system, response regulator PdtaR
MTCVLIVEDEPYILMAAEAMLEDAGYETVPAVTVAEAFGVLYSSKNVDLVFTDMQLGNHTDGGTVVAAVVKKQRPGTPVLYTSGHVTKCRPFLPKPYTDSALTKAVANVLREVDRDERSDAPN